MFIKKYENAEIINLNGLVDVNETKSRLQYICELYPDIAEKVNKSFNDLHDRRKTSIYNTIQKINDELESKKHLFKSVEEINQIFEEKIYIRNHMYCIKIKIPDENDLDLEHMSSIAKGAYYSKKKTPSMILFADDVFCCAILTKKGNINLVGGCTEEEIRYTLIQFLKSIEMALQSMSNLPYSIEISSIELHNMVISASLPLTGINLFNLTEYLPSCGISYRYIPENHDILTIKPLPLTKPSIFVRIFPTGGMFSFGFGSLEEINIVMSYIASIIIPYTVRRPCTPLDLQEWRLCLKASWARQKQNKIKRRKLKISSWTTDSNKDIID
jgi:TATA-box binding protein (TBP) (component of TFIID and TFIIIB)